jgi:hypothetical protein
MPTNLLDYRRTKTIANIETFYERNGTYLRALIAIPTTTADDLEVTKVQTDLAIGVSRIIILVALVHTPDSGVGLVGYAARE